MDRPAAAFAISLVAGILILLNGVLLGIVRTFLSFIPGLMAQYAPTTTPLGAAELAIAETVLFTMAIVGIIFGIIIILSSVMLYRNPTHKTVYGVLILVLSIISIVIGGGFIIGLILGIVGGALTLSWKPSSPQPTVK